MSESKVADYESNQDTSEIFPRNSVAWYHRHSGPIATLDSADEKFIPVLLVKIVDIHYDDSPNIYYTIAVEKPVLFTGGSDADLEQMMFEGEKQTDASHLIPDNTLNRNRTAGGTVSRRQSSFGGSPTSNDDPMKKSSKVRKSSLMLAGADKVAFQKRLEQEKVTSDDDNNTSPIKPSAEDDSTNGSDKREKPRRKSSISNLFGLLSFGDKEKVKKDHTDTPTKNDTNDAPTTTTATEDSATTTGTMTMTSEFVGSEFQPQAQSTILPAPFALPLQPAFNADRSSLSKPSTSTTSSTGIRRKSLARVISTKAAVSTAKEENKPEDVLQQLKLDNHLLTDYEEVWEVKAINEKVKEVIQVDDNLEAYEEVWERKFAKETAIEANHDNNTNNAKVETASNTTSTTATTKKSVAMLRRPSRKFVPPPPNNSKKAEETKVLTKRVSFSDKPPMVRQISETPTLPEGYELNAAISDLEAALNTAEELSPPPPSKRPLDEVELHHNQHSHFDLVHQGSTDIDDEPGVDPEEDDDRPLPNEDPEADGFNLTPTLVRRQSLRTAPPPPPMPPAV